MLPQERSIARRNVGCRSRGTGIRVAEDAHRSQVLRHCASHCCTLPAPAAKPMPTRRGRAMANRRRQPKARFATLRGPSCVSPSSRSTALTGLILRPDACRRTTRGLDSGASDPPGDPAGPRGFLDRLSHALPSFHALWLLVPIRLGERFTRNHRWATECMSHRQASRSGNTVGV